MCPGDTTVIDEQALSSKFPDVYNSLIPLLRYSTDSLNAYLETVACDVNIDSTRTRAHCRFIALDGNKRPRVKDFARYLVDRIVDYSIPRDKINNAKIELNNTGSSAAILRLNSEARNLFTHLPLSGEGGETLLSILAETILRIPQLFTKMVLKTASQMHIHGSDGIHVGVNKSNGNLSLYWGESKLYADAASAIRECFSSLAPFLLDAGGSDAEQERDLQLMRDGINLDNAELESALKAYLDPNNPKFKQLEYRGLCLVGFDSDAYPTEPNSMETEQLRQSIQETFKYCRGRIQDRVTTEKISSFEIEIFCLPFPSVDEFRSAFRTELGLKDEQS